ncbi:MAG: AMP-binding protein [Erysipelotrichaceae bacterium]|nr:AMP-binding protein [Erysipelotrichaceae bacterium]
MSQITRGFIEQLNENNRRSPNEATLFDDIYVHGLTNATLDDMSGKVYRYLKEQDIGRDDFILLNMPRGATCIIAMIGVWKAGAAFALVEETYAPERINYIRKDCGCIAEINKDNWTEIMSMDTLSGYEDVDDHDLAYAIYTSGTTGNPKGVLHEFGNLKRMIESINYQGMPFIKPKDRGALLAPLNFVASMMVIVYVLYMGGCRLYVASYETIKNPAKLAKFFLSKRISITFLTPSYVRMLNGKTGPFLKTLIVGSEPANDLYIKGVNIYNLYAMSESGFIVSSFKIDRTYDVCPIGQPQFDLDIKLLDEDGKECPPGETGELCFVNPYVRGYINLEEETKKAFYDGYYHTGDLATCNSNGDYILLGRSNDMIKINGNRIEPAEIEAAVKKVLNIEWCAAKGFNEKNQSFICAYYTDDIDIDLNYVRDELLKRLPYYMLPAHFVKIDEVPLKANGKFDRKALKAPEIKDMSAGYVAPENETEEALCKAFEKVCKLERVGVLDDFYELGGDSLSSIQVIVESGLPGLNASHIFRGRNIRNIAKIYQETLRSNGGESPEIRNAESMKREHPLTVEQLYMINYQLYTPRSTMYNLNSMLKFSLEQFDMRMLAKALYAAIRNHPALLTTYHFNEDGNIMQSYHPEILKEINVEHMLDKEFYFLKDTLVQPFKMFNSPLFRVRVFQTEKNGYAFFDVHHTVFDGSSFKVFLNDVVNAYMGQPMSNDYYYLMLEEREHDEQTEFYQESKEYFEDIYSDDDFMCAPRIDYNSRNNNLGEFINSLGINQIDISDFEKRLRISRNEFFLIVACMATAIYNKNNNIKLSWIYNGREDANSFNTVGLLFRNLPIAFRFKDDMTLREICASAHEQVQEGIKHSIYPYVEKNPSQIVSRNELGCLLYQQDIRDLGGMEDYDIETISIKQNKQASQSIIDMEVLDGSDGLQIFIDYAASRYKKQSMEAFNRIFIATGHILLLNTQNSEITYSKLKKDILADIGVFDKILSVFKIK